LGEYIGNTEGTLVESIHIGIVVDGEFVDIGTIVPVKVVIIASAAAAAAAPLHIKVV
jgi:hypothetical protein